MYNNRRSPSSNNRRGPGGGGRGGFSLNGRRQRFGSGKPELDFSKYINKNIAEVADNEPEVIMSENTYDMLPINDTLKKNILAKGYSNMTPIQDQTIPAILEGKDIIGIANTGTGKTAAFLIPMIQKVIMDKKQGVMIIAPTRELASQINDELRSLTGGLNIFSVLCIGGQNIFQQRNNLTRAHNFLICTPGRLKDLIQRRSVNMNSYSNIILDEVDRMFDMGFYKEIKIILDMLPRERHTLFFSATVSKDIEMMILKYMNQPVKVSVNTRQSSNSIEQDVIKVTPGSSKIETLHELLIQEDFKKVLIFGKTKHGVENLGRELRDRGFRADSIHGDKTQSARQKSLFMFKEDQIKILVATDVAARGLDIPDVTHVINYDVPATFEDYTHRIGRTGRGNKKGKALTFVS